MGETTAKRPGGRFANDRVHREDHFGPDQNRIDPGVGHRAVRAAAADRDGDFIAGGRDGGRRRDAHEADRIVHDVQTHAGVDALEHARLHHFRGAARGLLFGVLKEELHRPLDFVLEGQKKLCRSEEHRRVGVVPADVGDARDQGTTFKPLRLLHGESVNVGAKRDRAARALSALERRDAARGRGTHDVVVAHGAQFPLNVGHGFVLFETEFRMPVNVASPGEDVLVEFFGEKRIDERVEFGHGFPPFCRFGCLHDGKA